jgi:hypothetical protein
MANQNGKTRLFTCPTATDLQTMLIARANIMTAVQVILFGKAVRGLHPALILLTRMSDMSIKHVFCVAQGESHPPPNLAKELANMKD